MKRTRDVRVKFPRPKVWPLDDIVAPIDIAVHFGCHRNTPMNWATRYPDFPEALTVIGGRYVYSKREVIAWHAAKDWGAWGDNHYDK